MTQALYRKWRPQTWDEVIGQEHVTTTLRNAVAAGRVAHAYLFAGPRGTGKTTSARLLAKAVNCLAEEVSQRPCGACEHCTAIAEGRFLDLIEIDAASNNGVDDVRDLRDKVNFAPGYGRYKVYIIDEVHMLSGAAFNALLKTLEEPPAHAIFVLATTEVHKIPATVLSRCQRHEFRSIPVVEIVAALRKIAASEGLEVEDAALQLIARQATGSLRDAISLLDQLASAGEQVTLEMAQVVLGTSTEQAVLDLVDALLAEDAAEGLRVVHASLDAGADPRQFARQVVNYLRDLLLVRAGNADQVDALPEQRARMAEHAQAFSTSRLLDVIRAFNQAAAGARNAWHPALPLELAFMEALGGETQKAETPSAPAAASPPPPASSSAGATKAQAGRPAAAKPGNVPPEIARHWSQILRAVRERNPQTQALLNSCRPLGMKGNALVLGFNGDFAKSKMESDDHLEILRQAMEEVMGSAVPVICVVARGEDLPPEVDQNGMVATALRDLGGKIVDIQ